MSCAEIDTFTFDRHILDEADLKAVVLNELLHRSQGWQRAVIANEFRLGTTSVRADLAVFGTEFVGIEIKSERDSLKRLNAQVAAYAKYFDRVIVAVASRHLPNLDWKALHKADVWAISESGRISVASERSEFPETSCLSELLTFAQRSRHDLDDECPDSDATAIFELEFRKRFGETSDQFWRSVGDKQIAPSDLALLSRFRDRREVLSAWTRDQEAQWADWNALVKQLSPSAG